MRRRDVDVDVVVDVDEPRAPTSTSTATWVVALVVLSSSHALAQGRGADIQTRFQTPREEARIEIGQGPTAASQPHIAQGAANPDSGLEGRLYLRERPDALGEAARAFADEVLQRLLEEREH